MKIKINYIDSKLVLVLLFVFGTTMSGCEKYLDETQLPANTVAGEDVYAIDNTTSTVVTGVYLSMNNSGPFTGSANQNIGYTMGLYTDELKNVSANNFAEVFYKNAIQPSNSLNWSDLYRKIFVVNTAIAGINTSKGNLTYRDQWLGECHFLRAFFYYYLVNIYGDVPVALSNDFTINNRLFRSPQAQVYQQIIADLKLAQSLLSTEYKNGYGITTATRLRPNKATATALLARIYLYQKDWVNAEAMATELINNSATYQLLPLSQVFLANSRETIWSLANNTPKTSVAYSFYYNGMPATIVSPQTPATSSVYACINSPLLNLFETNDGRLTNWIRMSTTTASGSNPAVTYHFPNKYKSPVNNAEYEVLFRLAEQFLIRAEARAQLNKNTAIEDINAVRARAGATLLSGLNQTQLLEAIDKERQLELFTECGHRFFDLKRTGTIDAKLSAVNSLKGNTWAPYLAYWPIPTNDLIQNPNLTPNPGYVQ